MVTKDGLSVDVAEDMINEKKNRLVIPYYDSSNP